MDEMSSRKYIKEEEEEIVRNNNDDFPPTTVDTEQWKSTVSATMNENIRAEVIVMSLKINFLFFIWQNTEEDEARERGDKWKISEYTKKIIRLLNDQVETLEVIFSDKKLSFVLP